MIMSSNNIKSNNESHDKMLEEKNEDKKKKNKKMKQEDKEGVDTSNFTIEERLVAAVWVHERKLEKLSIAQIKINFRLRFGKPPPTKNTLYFWEKKIFATGKVFDAKRCGRPCRRKAHIPFVEASLKQAPGLSLRARAEQLSLPRSTLKKIMKEDLQLPSTENNSQCNSIPAASAENTVMPRQPKQTMPKQNTDQSTTNIPCSSLPPPPTYTYPETLGSLPLSAFQHYLSYPNNNHHQGPTILTVHSKIPGESQNHVPNSNVGPHMIQHQQHTHSINHHNFITNNQPMDKSHIGYPQNGNHHNNTRNQMTQSFHP